MCFLLQHIRKVSRPFLWSKTAELSFTGRSNLEVADVSKHEDLGMTGQEADVRDIAEECEEDEG